jgi:hypothetical protein
MNFRVTDDRYRRVLDRLLDVELRLGRIEAVLRSRAA